MKSLTTKTRVAWAVLLVIGVAFQLMHWPGAGALLIFGAFVFLGSSISGLLAAKDQALNKSLYALQCILITVAFIVLFLPPDIIGVDKLTAWNLWKSLLLLASLTEVYRVLKNRFAIPFAQMLLAVSFVIAAAGFVHIMFQWPYGGILIMASIGIGFIAYLLNFFMVRIEEEDQPESKD